MRQVNLVLLGVAIPVLLTATAFAVPGAGIFGTQANYATTSQTSQIAGSGALVGTAEAADSKTHNIVLVAETLENGLLAYRMDSHEIDDGTEAEDVTDRYSTEASIPGPTIVIDEGDEVNITIENDIDVPAGLVNDKVSLHVHGVHYTIDNDGTLEHVNMVEDQGASPGDSRTFHWIAGPGTAGTWPYHDHTFGGINGAEHRGLFGTLIVNPASGKLAAADGNKIKTVEVGDIAKDFILYVNDDAFWGMEIDSDGQQTPLWTNPTFGAKTGDYVRFHLIALGTDTVHEFNLEDYQWLEPGTKNLISEIEIGPLENHQFTIKTEQGTSDYYDANTSNQLMGMQGQLKVTNSGADSVPSDIPEAF